MSQLNVETEMAPTIRPLARLSAASLGAQWADPARGHFMTVITFHGSIHSPMDGGLDYDVA
ncbi:hypothetical protein GCM10007863_12430 [Dyella mobilis]|nr:hypothetical protein GCM10007863_12430 [Dyella mobilis]